MSWSYLLQFLSLSFYFKRGNMDSSFKQTSLLNNDSYLIMRLHPAKLQKGIKFSWHEHTETSQLYIESWFF